MNSCSTGLPVICRYNASPQSSTSSVQCIALWAPINVVVTQQHNCTLYLRGCIPMQSTTCPAVLEVNRCHLLDILRFKRTWRMAKMFAIGFEVPSTSPMSRTVFVGIRFFCPTFFCQRSDGKYATNSGRKMGGRKIVTMGVRYASDTQSPSTVKPPAFQTNLADGESVCDWF